MKKQVAQICAIAGFVAWMPSLATAFTGNLVRCTPTAGTAIDVTLKPGLTCTDTLNKLQVSATAKGGNQIDGCVSNAAAPWATWNASKVQKITAADAATISKLDLSMKGTTFGSCNFSGDSTSLAPSATGKFVFYNSSGAAISGGSGAFFAKVSGDVPSVSAIARGLVTKGFGIGASLEVKVGLDSGGPTFGLVAQCNLGAICPPDVFTGMSAQSPISVLALKTAAGNYVSFDLPDNANCTGSGTPIHCCTGAGTGTC